jgi:Na+/proline symporter
LVSSISGAIIGTILIYFINMYQDPSFMSVVTSSSLSTSYIFDSIIFPFIYLFSMLFIFSGIGGLVNLFIKK